MKKNIKNFSGSLLFTLINNRNIFPILIFLFFMFFTQAAFAAAATTSTSTGLFSELISRGAEIFNGMRDIIYVVSGFGIIGVSVGGFFGNMNWKWLGAIVIALMVIGLTGSILNFVVGGESQTGITNTLK